ncbi:MAG: hypothetical protein WCI02_03505 [Planctomycetota bacterium]
MSFLRVKAATRYPLAIAMLSLSMGSVVFEGNASADGGPSAPKLKRLKPYRQPDLVGLVSHQDPVKGPANLPPSEGLNLPPVLPDQDVKSETAELGITPVGVQDAPAIPTSDDAPKNSSGRSTEPLRLKPLPIPDISLDGIGTGTTPEDATAGRLPPAIALPYGPDRGREWYMSNYNWVAPVYCHNPNYYEDVMLEHHGQERCPPLQPVLSGARFYSGLFFTPYLAYLHPPCQEFSNAGHYRVGSPAPCLRQRAPYSPGAIRLQLLMTSTGVLALTPP